MTQKDRITAPARRLVSLGRVSRLTRSNGDGIVPESGNPARYRL